MESINHITIRTLQTPTSSSGNLSDSEWILRRNTLGQILLAYRESVQFNAPDEDDETIEMRAAAWLPLTSCIPINRLFDCYVYAMQNRTSSFPLSAQELIQAWRAIQDRNETYGDRTTSNRKMLPTNAAGACRRCWGKGREEMPDGSIGGPCSHEPLTDDEIAERVRVRDENLKRIFDEQKANRAAKVQTEKPQTIERVTGEILHCSHCPRKVNTLGGWQVGDVCGVVLEREQDGRLVRCAGQMVSK